MGYAPDGTVHRWPSEATEAQATFSLPQPASSQAVTRVACLAVADSAAEAEAEAVAEAEAAAVAALAVAAEVVAVAAAIPAAVAAVTAVVVGGKWLAATP